MLRGQPVLFQFRYVSARIPGRWTSRLFVCLSFFVRIFCLGIELKPASLWCHPWVRIVYFALKQRSAGPPTTHHVTKAISLSNSWLLSFSSPCIFPHWFSPVSSKSKVRIGSTHLTPFPWPRGGSPGHCHADPGCRFRSATCLLHQHSPGWGRVPGCRWGLRHREGPKFCPY